MSFAYWNNLPGVDTQVNTVENEYSFGPAGPFWCSGVALDTAAVDAGNTPASVLRRGLVLGIIAASGYAKQYDPAATDGSQRAVGILDTTTDLLDPRTAATRNKTAQMRLWGFVKAGQLYGFDENARLQLSPRFVFDDFRQELADFDLAVAKTADYTVLATDNGTLFTTDGAAGAVTFTLPACARGYRFRFAATVDQTMTIVAPAGKLVATDGTTGNNAATSVAFSTASKKIGSVVEITTNAAGSKYIAAILTPNTPTVA